MVQTIALLGTGTMGFGMAQVLLRAGFTVRVWNRHAVKAEPLAGKGAVVASTSTEAVQGADVVLTMLYDADAVLDVMTRAQGGLDPDVLWLQSSTVGLAGTKLLAAFARQHHLALLDAPVLGTKKPAEEGALVVLASGDPDLRERAEPVFEAIGSKTIWVGNEVGPASALKLVCNAWVGTITAAVGQSMALAAGLGLDADLFLTAIKGGATDTPYAHVKGAQILAEEFPPSFALDGAIKDLDLILAAADEAKINDSILTAVRAAYGQASSAGHGQEDMAAVYHALRESQE
jgi:3-hydroxyisobutyrate dehydrogenase